MKIILIGNRDHVFYELINNFNFDVITWARKNSLLEKAAIRENQKYFVFSLEEKSLITDVVEKADYDILISNGCPFILPITGKTMINIHPTYLPFLRGKTPINGVFFNSMSFYGATMHYISEIVDGGNIIYQEKHDVTKDLDLGLIYYLSFYLEGVVFNKGMKLLIENDFLYEGQPMETNKGSYFNRTLEKATVDFEVMSTKTILRIIKSFAVSHQGVSIKNIGSKRIKRIIDADEIENPLLLSLMKLINPGDVYLEYDQKIIVKTLDAAIRITRYVAF